MDSHEIREENVILRQRVAHSEQKLRQMAEALEKRNVQLREWAAMYNDLQKQFFEAQESANTQSAFIKERNQTIVRLTHMIEELRIDQQKQSNENSKAAAALRDEITNERLYLVETLNRLSQAKVPAAEAFQELGDLLEKKDKQIALFQNQYEELSKKYKSLNQELDNRDNDLQQLSNENDELSQMNRILKQQLLDAKSGRQELAKIEELNQVIETKRKKNLELEKSRSRLKKIGIKLRDDVKQRDSVIEQLQDNLERLSDRIEGDQCRLRDQQNKYDELREKYSKLVQSERRSNNKYQAKKNKNHNLKQQIELLQMQVKNSGEKKSKIAQNRLRVIKEDEQEQIKVRELKVDYRKEVEKRLEAEEQVFDLKDRIKELENEIALVRNQLTEAKGADTGPLIDLLKDLQIEAITIDSEYYELMNSIPEESTSDIIEITDDMCESPTVTAIIAKYTNYQIENKELRILLKRFARSASLYHRVSSIIANYPILSTEDVATQEERGNWVLPADVEHLQRTIVKLHELLIRQHPSYDV